MKRSSPSALAGGSVSVDSTLEEFSTLWETGEVGLDSFVERHCPFADTALIAELVKLDLEYRFAKGERPSAAEYFDRYPRLVENKDRVVSLVYIEYCLLEEAGEKPDPSRFCSGYSRWRDSLVSQLGYHRDLSQIAGTDRAPARFPEPGERFSRYHLRKLLGRGGVAHVYLATDEDLEGREVAIKISASFGREPSILARLNHPNIVPILSITEPSESGLQGFSMPYRPGITMDALIRDLGPQPLPGRTTSLGDLVREWTQTGHPGTADEPQGWAGFPVDGTYYQAVAWIAWRLAKALAYMHERDVVHRDIKPANVLLAFREGPQLLDFNLAEAPQASDRIQAELAMKGGTLPYMAPEQLRAFLDNSRWKDVVGSADLYSLGLVLRELVTGLAPEMPRQKLSLPRLIQGLLDRRASPMPSIRSLNPAVPPSLGSIIERCLEPQPADRYPTAQALADDLDRFLKRRPLQHARNPSLSERANNFAHRNRLGISVLILSAALAVGMAIAAPRPVDQTRAFEQAKSALRLGQIEQATELLRALQKSHPDSAWPSLYLALAHEAAGKHADANACFRDARHGQDAAEAFRQCGIDNPNSIVVLINQALFHVEHERYEPARAALDQAMKVNPRDIRVFALLGDIDRKQKRSEAAIANFLNAISLATHDPIEYQTLFECRKIALYLLDRQINTLLAHRTLARPEREALAGHAGRIETIVNAPGFLVEIPRDLGKDQPIRALEAYSRGIAAVARARCAGGRPASEPMLRTARMHLEASRRLSESTTDATQIPPIKELEKRIKEAESTLEPLHGESPL